MSRKRYFTIFVEIGAILFLTLSSVKAAEKPMLPPANVFDTVEIKNPDTLDLKILSNEIVPVLESYSKRV